MEHELYLWQMIVLKRLAKLKVLLARSVCGWWESRGLVVEGDSRLLDYIKDAIPEMETEQAAQAVAFHEVTDKDLPICCFMTGDVLVWNDAFIAKEHPARRHCGEGPFRVVRDESYLVAFEKDPIHNRVRGAIKVGNDRLVLLNLPTQCLIIAHGGVFTAA